MIQSYTLSTTLDGSGAGTADSQIIRGKILAVEVNYPANACTVDIDSLDLIGQKILNLASANTDRVVYPRTSAQDVTGTNLLYAAAGEIVPECFAVAGRLRLTVAGGTAADVVTVNVLVEGI